MSSKVRMASLVLVILFLTPLLFWSRMTGLEVGMRQPSSYTADTAVKTILLWTPSHPDSDSWGISQTGFSWEGHQHTDLSDLGCDQESYKCTITSNRSYLKDESLYDGFLFSENLINTLDIPDQAKRKANQVYVFTAYEAAITSLAWPVLQSVFSDLKSFFNVTMSFSSQSEIHMPIAKSDKVTDHPTGEKLDLFITSFGERNARHMTPKTPEKFSLIFTSNCQSNSQREKMLAELGRVVPVDVFGGCGAPSPAQFAVYTTDYLEEMKLISEKYQFYLSFENALCNDYITERFFNIFISNTNVIPVVMNGANMSQIAPKHSYIDVKDFATIRDLGNYLKKVSSDPALYASYFWSRQHYEFRSLRVGRNNVKILCEACRYLHSGKGPSMVEDLKKEWVDGSQCKQRPNISYIDEEDTAA